MQILSSFVLHGIDGVPVHVEIDTQNGIPHFSIVGLGDTSVQESRERIRSAIKNSGFSFPSKRITVNLAPAHLRKTGSHLDLAIALWLIGCAVPEDSKTGIIGELALNGEIRRMIGIIPLVLSAISLGFKQVLVPRENLTELTGIEGISIYWVGSLREAQEVLSGTMPIPTRPSWGSPPDASPPILLESILWQSAAKRALILAAAWKHSLLLEGPPGSGKSMLAGAIQGILPPLTQEERIDVGKIHSITGVLETGMPSRRPFRQIHRGASFSSVFWGGTLCRPWEISLAHAWVLFVDELLELDKRIIEWFREPLESWMVHISRVHGKYSYPAQCMLIGACNPCPCGFLWDERHPCTDSSSEITKYRGRLSWPILDRIDIHLLVPRIQPHELSSSSSEYTTKSAAEVVAQAHSRAIMRQGKSNAHLSPEETHSLDIDTAAKQLLLQWVERLALSIRGYHRILRLSRTIADLEWAKIIACEHVSEAIWYRRR